MADAAAGALSSERFTVQSAFDKVYGDVSAGVDLITLAGLDVKLNYDGRFGEHSELHSGGLKVGLHF